jgi:hypothetical protein
MKRFRVHSPARANLEVGVCNPNECNPNECNPNVQPIGFNSLSYRNNFFKRKDHSPISLISSIPKRHLVLQAALSARAKTIIFDGDHQNSIVLHKLAGCFGHGALTKGTLTKVQFSYLIIKVACYAKSRLCLHY